MINKNTIIRLAREAGGTPYVNRHFPGETAMGFGPQALQDFAQAIYRQGLEDAAKVCEANQDFDIESHPARIVFSTANVMARKCATAIRALGEQQ